MRNRTLLVPIILCFGAVLACREFVQAKDPDAAAKRDPAAGCGNGRCEPERGETSDLCGRDCKWPPQKRPPAPNLLQMLYWNWRYGDDFPKYDGSQPKVKSLSLFKEDAGYPDWSPVTDLVAYNKMRITVDRGEGRKLRLGGTSEIYTARGDGTGEKCLTCGKPGAPKGFKGQPFWHPGGRHIIFHAENGHSDRRMASIPGLGFNYDLWLMTADGDRYWRLTDYPKNWGVYRGRFSPDGKTLHWNEEFSMERYPGVGVPWSWKNPIGEEEGSFRIKLADFEFDASGNPVLSNVRKVDYEPGLRLLESEGFTHDGKRLIFTSSRPGESAGHSWFGDVYTSDLDGGSLTRLTKTPFNHDENAEHSPDGKKIVWSGCSWLGWTYINKQELYLMDSDGSNKKRITFLNDPKHEHYIKRRSGGVAAGELTWSPDGKKVVFHVIKSDSNAFRVTEMGADLYILELDR